MVLTLYINIISQLDYLILLYFLIETYIRAYSKLLGYKSYINKNIFLLYKFHFSWEKKFVKKCNHFNNYSSCFSGIFLKLTKIKKLKKFYINFQIKNLFLEKSNQIL